MSTPNINTSSAEQVYVELFEIGDVNMTGSYATTGTPIDLTDYKIEFLLKENYSLIKSYSINAGSLTSTYIIKTGDNNEIIDMTLMWADIQKEVNIDRNPNYKLIQVVTDPDGTVEVYMVFNIHARKY